MVATSHRPLLITITVETQNLEQPPSPSGNFLLVLDPERKNWLRLKLKSLWMNIKNLLANQILQLFLQILLCLLVEIFQVPTSVSLSFSAALHSSVFVLTWLSLSIITGTAEANVANAFNYSLQFLVCKYPPHLDTSSSHLDFISSLPRIECKALPHLIRVVSTSRQSFCVPSQCFVSHCVSCAAYLTINYLPYSPISLQSVGGSICHHTKANFELYLHKYL